MTAVAAVLAERRNEVGKNQLAMVLWRRTQAVEGAGSCSTSTGPGDSGKPGFNFLMSALRLLSRSEDRRWVVVEFDAGSNNVNARPGGP